MKTFNHMAAQGDLLLRCIGAPSTPLPPDAAPQTHRGDGAAIVAHSDSGHHHVAMGGRGAVQLFASSDPLKSYLLAKESSELRHERSYDTHESILIPPGLYEVRRQRESVPEGWRRVED